MTTSRAAAASSLSLAMFDDDGNLIDKEELSKSNLYKDFVSFSKVSMIDGGSVHFDMVIYYFRQAFPNAYLFKEQVSDNEIRAVFQMFLFLTDKKDVERNEFGMYSGIQMDTATHQKLRQEAEQKHKIQKIKYLIKEYKRTKKQIPLPVFKAAVQLGIISREQVQKRVAEAKARKLAREQAQSQAAQTQSQSSQPEKEKEEEEESGDDDDDDSGGDDDDDSGSEKEEEGEGTKKKQRVKKKKKMRRKKKTPEVDEHGNEVVDEHGKKKKKKKKRKKKKLAKEKSLHDVLRGKMEKAESVMVFKRVSPKTNLL